MMEEIIGVLIVLAVLCILSGPVALIISIFALNKVRQKFPEAQKQIVYEPKQTPIETKPIEISSPPPFRQEEKPVEVVKEEVREQKEVAADYEKYVQQEKEQKPVQTGVWEQKIGTRWILIAGIITVFVGIAFFLKYYHDNFLRSPLQRVMTVTIFGLVTLAAGEFTRRKGFGIVAKGVTALGFGILYAAVFTAYQTYNLIDYIPACVLATIITVAAMIYAVALDEVLIAFLSLLGGFGTPVLVLTKMTTPTPLFIYMLILGAGAMACAYYRKWKTVNLLAFVGTFILYSIWFYDSQFYSSRFAIQIGDVRQIIFELSWLGVFFILYLVMPVLFGLVNRVASNKQDVLLILSNAAITLYYLFDVLSDRYRHSLALCVLVLALIFLAFSAVVYYRCKEDKNLRISLHAIGIFCATLAVPLYFKLDATTVTWALESAVLVFIGMRYKSILTQAAGLIVMGLSVGCLLMNLPMHDETFKLIINAQFGQWLIVAVAVFVIHILYRTKTEFDKFNYQVLTQLLFGFSMLIIFAACSQEWFYHCKYNLVSSFDLHLIARGQFLIFAAMVLLFLPSFVRPKGQISEFFSYLVIAGGSVFFAVALTELHEGSFKLFANIDFAALSTFIASILIYQIVYRRTLKLGTQFLYILFGVLFFFAISAEWYFKWKTGKIFNQGMIVIFALVIQLLVIRPLTSAGILTKIAAFAFSIIGVLFTLTNYAYLQNSQFLIFFNINFAIAFLFIIGLFAAAWFVSRDKEQTNENNIFRAVFSIIAIFMFLILLTQEIYLFWQHRMVDGMRPANWEFLAQMFISITWAIYAAVLMLIGFWKNIRALRYISLAIFACLLLKVFLIDTREIKNIYRVAAFLVTGITLVGVSYLYQFLKNNGFFDTLFLNESVKKD
ncbi:MAG: DUF2339 domain-containing protein [Phycisphaerales bacterium]